MYKLPIPVDFKPVTYEFESVAAGLRDCTCPHCGQEVQYVTARAPRQVICPECEGEIPVP